MRAIMASVLYIVVSLCPSLVFAHDKFFESAGVQIRYVEQGSGEPIVLVHGYTNYLDREWVETGIMADLAKDHHVIAFDLRGHGKSGKPHESSKYGVQLSQDIVRLLDHLEIPRAHIVGYSLGANIVAKLLTTNPQRFITATLGGASGRRNWTEQNSRDAEAAAAELEHGVPYRSLVLQTWPTDQPQPAEETIRERSLQLVARNDPLAHAAMVRARQDEVVTDAQMAAVRVPTLAIVGSADGALAGVKALGVAWPALKVVVIDGASHARERGALSRPEFVQGMRAFLSAHPSTPIK